MQTATASYAAPGTARPQPAAGMAAAL